MNITYECLLNQGQLSQLSLGSTLSNSVTATDITPGGNVAGQAFTFPANYLQAGQQFRLRCRGILSNTGTPTLVLGVYLGGVAGVALAATGALATASGLSSAPFLLDCDLRVESTGSAGAIRALGAVTGPYGAAPTLIPSSAPGGNSVAVNTGVAQVLTVGATWGTASASNSIQAVMFTVERLNEGGS